MKKISKILSLLLIVLILLTSAPLSGFAGIELLSFSTISAKAEENSYLTSGYCGDTSDGGDETDIYWELSDDGVLTINGTGKIAPKAFNNDLRIKEVIIGDGITNVSSNCFTNCSNITKVTLGKDIEIVDISAFEWCSSLTDINLPNGLTTINLRAFAYCPIESINLPESLTTLGSQAFLCCYALTSINLPKNITTIENQTFSSCFALTSVSIPDSITSLGYSAFYGCPNLKQVYIGAGVTSLQYDTFASCTSLSDITISEKNSTYSSVDGIVYNKEKTEIILVPEGINKEITIPATVTEISYSAFSYTGDIPAIHIADGNPTYKSVNGIVYTSDGKTLVICPTGKQGKITVADGTVTIGNHAFNKCSSITEISLPESIETIDHYAFSYCGNLVYINLSAELKNIGNCAFESCKNLTSIYIPDSVTALGVYVFSGCTKLTQIYIGAGINNIDKSIFNYCDAMTNIIISEKNSTFTSVDGIIYNKEKTNLIMLPPAISGKITIPSTITELPLSLLYNCNNLTDINIETGSLNYKSINGIVYSADGKTLIVCPRGKQGIVTIQNGTETIEYRAFEYCNEITDVFIPDGLTTIKSQAFNSCNKLKSVNLPEGLKYLELSVFYNCTALTEISFPKSLIRIHNNAAFDYCGFTELTIPEHIQSFDIVNLPNLKTLTIENRYCQYTTTMRPKYGPDCVIRAACGSYGHELAIKSLINFDSTEHTYLDWYTYKAATYKATGIMRRDCAYCDEHEEKVIPKLENTVFTATFVANDKVVATVDFAKGTTEITEPKVPAKDRYIGEWEEYTLADADITINAVYTLIKSADASEIEADSEVIHYLDKDDVLFRIKVNAEANVVKSTVSQSVPLDIVLIVDQSGSMDETLGGRTKKVDALKDTAKDFVNTVFENAKMTDANHRISIVGFGLSGTYQGFEKNENTELLTSAKGIVKFDNIKTTDYAASLLSVNVDGNVNDALLTAINAIDAKGATAADLGFEMAKGVFANTDSEGRQRVVVFMTDGEPTYLSGFQTSVANSAIINAHTLKNAYGASIYSVGVFSDSDSRNSNIKKFMNAVSSGYPEAMSMSSLGKGVEGQYYLTVNNTDSLTSVFKTISTESLSHTAPFDDVTVIKTLSENVTMTSEQEEQLRIDLIRKYGITNEDILIIRNEDGTTTIQVNYLSPYEVTDNEGTATYEIAFEFFASLNENTAETGDYTVDTEDSGVMLGSDAKGYELTFETSVISLTSKKTRVIFTVNGEVYEVSEKLSNGYAVAPEIEVSENWTFSGWDTAGQKASNGLVLDATLTKTDRTVTWYTADGNILQTYKAGDIITVPTLDKNTDGDPFLSWDKSIPTTMPDENLEFTAVYGGHVHNYTSEVTKEMTCLTDGVRTFTCSCSDTYDEVITAIGHNYEAITPSLEKDDAKCTFVCTNCGDKYDYALDYQVVESTGKKTRVLYEFNLTDDELNMDIQPDGEIYIRIPLSELHGSAEYVTVIRTNKDGSKTEVPAYHEKGFLIITCDHFTPYEVVFKLPYDGHIPGDWIVTKEATCTEEGSRYAICAECEQTIEESIEKLPHTESEWITDSEATCTEEGSMHTECTECSTVINTKTIEKTDHSYDGTNCTYCGNTNDVDCSHMCHKSGFVGFFWKIINFLQRIFGISPVCECGAAHY